jgi:hypothetical protein
VNTVHSAQLTARARLCAAADAHIILEAAMAAATTSGGGLVNEMDEIDQLPSFDTHLSRSDSGGSSGSGGAPGEGLGEQRFKFELADLESWQVCIEIVDKITGLDSSVILFVLVLLFVFSSHCKSVPSLKFCYCAFRWL